MKPLSYLQPKTVAEAVAAINHYPNSGFLAGGTTLVDLLKEGVPGPDVLIDINDLPLTEIEVTGPFTSIGTLVRNSDLAWHPEIGRRFGVLRDALLSGASGQIRNMATVGGNLLQRTRCPYFRDTSMPCNKRQPGSGCSALDGYHRMRAILGVSEHCIAEHPSDMAVALAALDTKVRVTGSHGAREIPLTEFYLEPGSTPERETVLARDEMILGISIPNAPEWTRSLYLKVRDRESYEFALASAAVAVRVNGGRIEQARIALGGVGSKPWRAMAAEHILENQPPSAELFRKAGQAALQGARPRRDNAFKVELAQRTLAQALTAATERI